MKDIQQLIKRDNQEGKYKDIFPQTYIEAISDKQTGVGLDQILNSFNMYFLNYLGDASITRLQVIDKLRRQGLWITYVTFDNKVIIEWYNSTDLSNTAWANSSNWMQGNNMLVGDITISSNGTWVVNGVDTGVIAQGPKGNDGIDGTDGINGVDGKTPQLRATSTYIQYSYDGVNWVNIISLEAITRNNLSGKKVSFIGDSITAGTDCSQLPYHQVFCSKYNCVDNPLGIGGSCIANNTKNGLSAQRFVTRATQSNLQDSSLIIVFGGTNDFSYDSKPVGDSFVESDITPSGNIGSKKLVAPTDTDTFTGALHELINTIRTNCPQVPIVFITPLQRGRYNSNNPNSDETNSNGNYLSDFSKAIKEICSFYSIPVLDLGSISQLDFMNSEISAKYSSDNLHPNCAGHKLIGELLFRFVEDNVVII